MTNEELFDIMRPIILAATGVPECIFGDPNIGSPGGDYCSVRVATNVVERGQAIIYRENSGPQDLQVDVKAQLISEVSINFYRGDAHHYARKLKQANKRPDISALLFADNIGWNRVGPVNNLTALQSGNQEERAQVSIFVMYEEFDIGDSVTINAIEKVPFEIIDEEERLLASGIVE